MSPREARERLTRWTKDCPGCWPLAEAALLLAVDEYPDLELEPHLAYLGELAGRVRQRLPGSAPPASAGLAALCGVLFEEEGFRGNKEDYDDPRNSYLNEVLDRRIGLPITLSVVTIEVARRAGLPVSGVGFPGHFLTRYEDPTEPRFLDPFHQGRERSREELRRQWPQVAGGSAWSEKALNTLPDERILIRILNNLKAAYARRHEFGRAVLVEEKLALLDPATAAHERDLGYLHFANREPGRAIGCLEAYLKRAPDAPDREQVLQNLRAISASLSRWN
jgi:regulator of sirC expression with transglutaminase-like and TPR domain